MNGYLVVVSNPAICPYRGVDRVPPYPAEFDSESAACDAYVFGGFKCRDTNLIPSIDAAVRLLKMFSASPRRFEIIRCTDRTDESHESRNVNDSANTLYGYDVAVVIGDFWSIVDDMPKDAWAAPYLTSKNAYGLFPEKTTAEQYLLDYRKNAGLDSDFDFSVVAVYGVSVHGGCSGEEMPPSEEIKGVRTH
jgi:hypothetical protein